MRPAAIIAALLVLGAAPAHGQTAPVTPDSAAAAPLPAIAGTPRPTAAAAADSVEMALEESRGFLRDGDYDRSIEVLKAALPGAQRRRQRLQALYLQLIKTYVFLGNDLKFKPQGREASNLNYQEARRLIAECLKTRELRHTRPEPASDYPPEMVTFFAETRREMFGSFRVPDVKPAFAVVTLDGDTMRTQPGRRELGDVDIAVGPHSVVVRAKGYKDLTERVTVSPGGTLERSYRMTKRHGPAWYALRGAGAAVLVGGITAIASNGDNGSGTPVAEPLPGAPGPPSSP